jgi:hypothetical protein
MPMTDIHNFVGQLVNIRLEPNQITIQLLDEGHDWLDDQHMPWGETEQPGYLWKRSALDILHDLLEEHLTEPRWTWDLVPPEQLGALTSAPIICYGARFDDDLEELLDPGRVFWFPSYMVVDELAELLEHGYVVFPEAEAAE